MRLDLPVHMQMHVISSLVREHENLRMIMDDCELMADQVDAGTGSVAELLSKVSRLRVALAEHNQHEEARLPAILKAADSFGELRIQHMLTTHVHEHRSMDDRLASRPTSSLRVTIDNLRDHLAIEELYFAIACAGTRGRSIAGVSARSADAPNLGPRVPLEETDTVEDRLDIFELRR